jgi:hypothetical protein
MNYFICCNFLEGGYEVGLESLKAMVMDSWEITLCNRMEVNRRFGEMSSPSSGSDMPSNETNIKQVVICTLRQV